jgi:hypothetical protein
MMTVTVGPGTTAMKNAAVIKAMREAVSGIDMGSEIRSRS